MKIIHTADIHLDSKLSAHLDSRRSRQRKTEILLSFKAMVRYAVENKVTAVIIAGDLFDSDVILPATRDIVLGEIASAHGVNFLYLCGNHDAGKALEDSAHPENLKFFGNRWTRFDYGNVSVYGTKLDAGNCRTAYGELSTDPCRFNIVTMHGAIGTTYGEDAVNKSALCQKNIDYLALGHYHSHWEEPLDKRGTVCYCGCLDGRGFDECGKKGFCVLDIDGNTYKSEFVSVSSREIFDIECDVTGLSTADDICKSVEKSVGSVPPESIVRATLTGEIPADAHKDLEMIKAELAERFWASDVKDCTRLYIDPLSYMNDVSLKGEFIRLLMESDLPKEQRDRVIRCGLNAISGLEVTE